MSVELLQFHRQVLLEVHWMACDPQLRCGLAGRQQLTVVAGNKGDGGPFAPLVKIVRGYMGVKEFNQFRGKAISLHSQGPLKVD